MKRKGQKIRILRDRVTALEDMVKTLLRSKDRKEPKVTAKDRPKVVAKTA